MERVLERKAAMIESADEFVRLRNSGNPEEYARAANECAKVEVWREVIRRFPEMKTWVAHNKNISLVILRELALDFDEEVRNAVACKRKLDSHLFQILGRDKSTLVRSSIAQNPKVPPDILSELARDPDKFVRESAIRRLHADNTNTNGGN